MPKGKSTPHSTDESRFVCALNVKDKALYYRGYHRGYARGSARYALDQQTALIARLQTQVKNLEGILKNEIAPIAENFISRPLGDAPMRLGDA